MFFGVFDFTFVVWMFVGAVSVLIVLGAKEWFTEKGIIMSWWKWLIAMIGYIIFMMGIAAPFTLMGEGETGAGWKMLIFSVPIIVILAFAIYRILLTGASEKEA